MLVGRRHELELFDALAEAAASGCGSRLLLVGDPGLGRTALLDAAHRRSLRRGVRAVHLRASLGQDRIPYSLLEDLARVVGRPPVTLDSTPAWDRALLSLLAALARERPTFLLLDDADFADPPSLPILRTALERLRDTPLSAVIAARVHPPTLAVFAGWPRHDLAPLEPDASAAVLRAARRLGEESISTVVIQALAGNPLALVHAARTLSPEQLAGQAPLPGPRPEDPLCAAWAPVLARLPGPARLALVDLAVSGGRPDLLGSMAPNRGDETSALDDAIAAGIVVLDSQGRPRFRAAAARSATLALAEPGQVRDAHRRAADGARRLGLPAAVVVDHLRSSVLTPDAATAAAIAEQAVRAEREEHVEVAADAWQSAAMLSPDRGDRVARGLAAVRLAYQVGMPLPEEILELIASEYLDPATADKVASLRAERRLDIDPRSALTGMLAEFERTRRATPEFAVLLAFDIALTAWELGEPGIGLHAARALSDLVQRGVRDADGWIPPWAGDAMLAAALFQAGEVAASTPLRRRAIAAARHVDPRAIDLPTLMIIDTLDDVLLDDSPEAVDRAMVELERTGDNPSLSPCRYGLHAWRARARGDWASSTHLLAIGRPMAERAGQIQPWLGMTALAVELAALQGRDEALRLEAQRLREVGTRCGDRRRLATLDRALGLRALVDGNLVEALAALAAAADVGFLGRGLRDGVLPARVDLIEVLVRTGDLAEAARRYAELHPLLTAMDDPLAAALDERVAALITGGAAAEAHFDAALRAHARSGEPFEWARTRLLLGEHLRRHRHRTEARRPLHQAVHAFEALRADPWADRARQELRAIGGRSHRGAQATLVELAALTPQERAVAQAAAEGRSNREIAEALVLSVRTVEYHLGNAYRKLGVHGRAGLARAMVVGQARTRLQ